jgi:glutamyl/glutaminyl-tRNA synthetase
VTGLIHHFKKTRIAPTPSGFLHLGNILSFAITAAIARQSGAKILLRIDDLDQARVEKRYIQDIFDTLNFLEIPWDEGPGNIKEFEDSYSQLHRMHAYHEALKQLSENSLVFACTCSRRQMNNGDQDNTRPCNCLSRKLSLDKEDACWRLITGNNAAPAVKNYIGGIIQAALPPEMDNFIVKKKDGFPSYQLASVIDDLFYGVDLVVRGEDLWPSTLAQHQLALALEKNNFNQIAFYHHLLLAETAGKKLSKSAGATSVRYLREDGKTPEDIYTIIARMLGINNSIANWQQLAGIIVPEFN